MHVSRLDAVAPSAPAGLATADRVAHDVALARNAVPAAERAAWSPAAPRSSAPVVAAAEVATARSGGAAGPSATRLAELAGNVYLDAASPPAGYRVATEADLARIGVTPVMLATQANGFRARAYVTGSGEQARVVIAFRGSQQGGDWAANARQAVGLNTGHYESALRIGRAVARSGADNVTFTGHSLGGGLASAAGLASGGAAATFNAAGLSRATIERADAIRTASGRAVPDIRAYFVRGEVLSALQDGGDRVAGALLFGPLGARIDAPEAYETRIELDAVAPAGTRFWERNPVDKHGMDWVIASLRGR